MPPRSSTGNAIGSHLPEAIILLGGADVRGPVADDQVGHPAEIKAILMNLLTVGAALSPLVLIYQHGNLTGLLGYTPNGGVEPTDFVVAATVVFALSTDYGVFLLGRIKEAREANPGDEREAVAVGLAATGRVVTAAAILLAVAIGAFSTSSIPFIQQIGVCRGHGRAVGRVRGAVAAGPVADGAAREMELVVAAAELPPAPPAGWRPPRPGQRLGAPPCFPEASPDGHCRSAGTWPGGSPAQRFCSTGCRCSW